MVGQGMLRPQPDKVAKAIHAAPPKSKKVVRSFMGLVGHYGKFMPNLAVIAFTADRFDQGTKVS